MKDAVKIIGPAIPGAIATGLVWFYVNRFVPNAGPGVLERQVWPINNIYVCMAIGSMLAAASGIIAVFFGNRRRQAMEAAAALAGFRFHGTVDRNSLKISSNLNVLDNWSEGTNYCVGQVGRSDVQVVDVRTVRTHRGANLGDAGHGNRNTTTEKQTVFLLSTGEKVFPKISIIHNNRLSWALGLFGLQGIEFYADDTTASEQDRQLLEQFRRDFLVTQGVVEKSRTSTGDSPDQMQLFEELKTLITMPVLKKLVESEWSLECCPTHVAVWKARKLVGPSEFSQQLQDVAALYQLLLDGKSSRSSSELQVRGSATMSIDTGVTNLAPLAIGGCAGMFLAMGMFIPIFFLLADKHPWIVFVWPVFGMGVIVGSAVLASRFAKSWKR